MPKLRVPAADSFRMSNLRVLFAGVVFQTNRAVTESKRSVRLTPWSTRWASTCDGEVLAKIVSTWDPKLALLLLKHNPHIKREHLSSLVALDDAQVRSALVLHPECSKKMLRHFVQYGGEMVRASVAMRTDLPDDIQQALLYDRSPAVRASLALNPSIPETLRVFAALR
jgi:hypothetical protein